MDIDSLPERMQALLERRLPDAGMIAITECEPLTGGYSCEMARVTAEIDGDIHRYVVRCKAPDGAAVLENDLMEEWRVLEALTRAGSVPMPRALYVDVDGSELGAEGIVLEFAGGGNMLSRVRSAAEDAHPALAEALCDVMAEVHAVDTSALPATTPRPSDWDVYLDELIQSWRDTEAELDGAIPMLRYMAAWLDANRPPATAFALVHGEFQPSNLVYDDDGRLLAVDWEFAHVGDPREDIGWCKWVEAVQPPPLIGIDDQAFCERYCERSGLTPDVVNPLTVAYFSILPAMRVFAGVLRGQQAFARGENTSIRVGYLVGAVVTAYEGWFGATRQIEAATAAMKEVAA